MVDTGKQQVAIRNNSDHSVVNVDALAWYAATVLTHLPEAAKESDFGRIPLLVGTAHTKGDYA